MFVSLASMHVVAQPTPVILRLRGAGIGSDWSMQGHGTDVQVVTNLVYVSWGNESDTNHPGGLEIFSVNNPIFPIRLGGHESHSEVNALQKAGRYVYLAEGASKTSTNDPGVFEIVDLNNPLKLEHVASAGTLGRANGLRILGDYAYLAESTRWTGSNLVGALEIFDIRTPTNPVCIGRYDTGGSVTSIDVAGAYAYLADGVNDFLVLDISDARNPKPVSSYSSNPSEDACQIEPGRPAHYVQVVGNRAYSAGDNGLNVVDVSIPAQPVRLGHNFCLPVYSLHVEGTLAFVTMWSSLRNTFLLGVVDATDPASPVMAGRADGYGFSGMQLVSRWIYSASIPMLVYENTGQPAFTSLTHNYDSLILTWDFAPGFALQQTSSIQNPNWSDVPGSADLTRLELPAADGAHFYRLARTYLSNGFKN
jgi:hypothetical protein